MDDDEVARTILHDIIVAKDVEKAERTLLAMPGLKRYMSRLPNDREKEWFLRHLRKYIYMYLPDCPFEITTTNRYTITNYEAAVCARQYIRKGDEIKYLTGTLVPVTREEELDLGFTRKDFSIVMSSRKKTPSFFLGPARFANHDCDANARLTIRGKEGMHIVAAKDIDIDEEITVSYGENYFGIDNCECLCFTCEQAVRNGWSPTNDDGDDDNEDEEVDAERESQLFPSGLPVLDDDGDAALAPRRSGLRKRGQSNSGSEMMVPPRKMPKRGRPPAPKPKDEMTLYGVGEDIDSQSSTSRETEESHGWSPSTAQTSVSGTEGTIDDIGEKIDVAQRRRSKRLLSRNDTRSDVGSVARQRPCRGTKAKIQAQTERGDKSSFGNGVSSDIETAMELRLRRGSKTQDPTESTPVKDIASGVGTAMELRRLRGRSAMQAQSNSSNIRNGTALDDWIGAGKRPRRGRRRKIQTQVGPDGSASYGESVGRKRQRSRNQVSESQVSDEEQPRQARVPGDYFRTRQLLVLPCDRWIECGTCDSWFVQNNSYQMRRECPRCERHSKLYGFQWPKTDKEGSMDDEERVMDHRTVHRFLRYDERAHVFSHKHRRGYRGSTSPTPGVDDYSKETGDDMSNVRATRRRTRQARLIA